MQVGVEKGGDGKGWVVAGGAKGGGVTAWFGGGGVGGREGEKERRGCVMIPSLK